MHPSPFAKPSTSLQLLSALYSLRTLGWTRACTVLGENGPKLPAASNIWLLVQNGVVLSVKWHSWGFMEEISSRLPQ